MWQGESSVCEFQAAGGVLYLWIKLMVITPWFLGVKVGETEFENGEWVAFESRSPCASTSVILVL